MTACSDAPGGGAARVPRGGVRHAAAMAIPEAVRNLRDLSREVVRAVRAERAGNALHRPAPPRSGFVLDVGAGHAPTPRADLVVDKYAADNFERTTDLSVLKPLVIGDGQALPFADGTFAYVIASHVLEHATDPPLFAGELSRVARAGWVQVPSRESELTFGWPFHPWLIDLEQPDTLVFRARGDARAPIGTVFHEAARDSYMFRLWMGADKSRWFHSLHWRGSLGVRCEDESAAEAVASFDLEQTVAVLERAAAAGPTGRLRDRLRCPVDGGALREAAGRMTCADCDRGYPLAGTVTVLLALAAA